MSVACLSPPRRGSSRIRVVVANSHRLMIEGIRRTLAAAGGIEIVGETNSGAAVLPIVGETWPDLVLVDLHIPDLDGFGCLERLRRHHPDVKVVLLASDADGTSVTHAREQGAAGFILEGVAPADLIGAIHQAQDENWSHVLGPPQPDEDGLARDAGLTTREIAVLRGLGHGQPTKIIASKHNISESAVRFHLGNIYRKLGVTNRTQAARHAYRLGLTRLSERDS
jgi:DNA-binding NarL/FixJ family response regulator